MNSLNRVRPAVQFKCSFSGHSLSYVQIVRRPGQVDNYQEVSPVVVNNAMANFNRSRGL
ncbi:hypothetical protein JOE25_002883 [Serratia sp. PL17]|nr:hypothetical protein [Serratia sp. PL17]